MANKNVFGVCKLCLESKKLCKSHYIPRSLYRLCRENGKHPIVATPTVVQHSPRQMWKHLLCDECEQRFRIRGEDYVIDQCYRGARFSLLERIELAGFVGHSGDVPFYSGLQLDIKTHKLAYFALSLVWRGAQGPWWTLNEQTTECNIGEFEECIRQYLCGDSTWPQNVVVVTTVCTDVGSQESINPPWPIPDDIHHVRFKAIEILVRGIWFWILLGETPKQIAEWCSVNSREKILFMRDCTDDIVSSYRHYLETAEDRTKRHDLH